MEDVKTTRIQPVPERRIASRYRLLAPIGEGGMGTVWRAQDETLHREVAVKEVRVSAGLPAADRAKMYTRLEREAWAAARIASQNVVTVYDVATDDGRPWIVMEFVRGRSLADLLRDEGPQSPQLTAQIGVEILSALCAAHSAGVLHRDVKPANVLLADDGRVVLTDFGIATVEGDTSLTATGEVVGSPEYLPPERALGRTPGPESDLWSLGILLYAAMEGATPFRQDTVLGTMRAIVDGPLPSTKHCGPLAPVIEGLLRKEPAERISAEQAVNQLQRVASDSTASPTPSTVVAIPNEADPNGRTRTQGLPARTESMAATLTSAQTAYPPVQSAGEAGQSEEAIHRKTTALTAPGQPAASSHPISDGRTPKRRSAILMTTFLSIGVLLITGLSYALLDAEQGNGNNTNGAANGDGLSHSANDASPKDGETSNTGQRGSVIRRQMEATPTNPGSLASQTVRVTVTGDNTTYVGSCSPPADQAPTFTATFAVDQAPSKITYRWFSKDGSVVDHEWRSLTFGANEDRTGQDTVRLTTYQSGGTLASEIGVEVKSSPNARSNTVPFSVTCE
ncbi:serine/threonine-protein kinase (plasmid) [Streptomyces sp. AHU1]|uniref:serine/threonine-protein kinase n=1 Tax=Streptomyces sp. AHU1 TaxID=3377215 RepID=UPI00387817D8